LAMKRFETTIRPHASLPSRPLPLSHLRHHSLRRIAAGDGRRARFRPAACTETQGLGTAAGTGAYAARYREGGQLGSGRFGG
jgi:hypothetical protein